jgi:hypothetical protein
MNRCPICHTRAQYNEDNASLMCCRCGSELHYLFQLDKQVDRLVQLALYRLINHDKNGALTCLKQSLALHDMPLVRYIHAFIENAFYTTQGSEKVWEYL